MHQCTAATSIQQGALVQRQLSDRQECCIYLLIEAIYLYLYL